VEGCQRHALAAVPLGKTRYPLYRRLCGPQSRSARVRVISTPPGFVPLTVQRVARINTTTATTTTTTTTTTNNNNNNNNNNNSMDNVEREIMSVSLNKKKYLMILTITIILFFGDIRYRLGCTADHLILVLSLFAGFHRFHFQSGPCGICRGKSNRATGFSPGTSLFPCHWSFHQYSTLIHLSSSGWRGVSRDR